LIERARLARLKQLGDPEAERLRVEAVRSAMQNPNTKEKCRAAQAKCYTTPELEAKRREGLVRSRRRPEVKEFFRRQMIQLHVEGRLTQYLFTRPHQLLKKALQDAAFEGFLTEQPVAGFLVDEVNYRLRIAIEMDGCYWHQCPLHGESRPSVAVAKCKNRDRKEEEVLKTLGWILLRFWEHEINEDLQDVVARVRAAVDERMRAFASA
jgi:very-short-patch-repair endonuclease